LSDIQFCRSSGSQTGSAGEQQNVRKPDHIEIDNPQGLPIETLDVIDREKGKKSGSLKVFIQNRTNP